MAVRVANTWLGCSGLSSNEVTAHPKYQKTFSISARDIVFAAKFGGPNYVMPCQASKRPI